MQGAKIGFIGAGAMAEALITGIINAGRYQPAEVCASDINRERLEYLGQCGIQTTLDNRMLVQQASLVVLAVKPQVAEKVLAELSGIWEPGQILVSIVAGLPLHRLQKMVGPEVAVIRAMPNNPCLIQQGATGLAAGQGVAAAQLALARQLFEATGLVVEVPEHLLDAVTGLSGSGPAYVYLILEAMSDAGVLVGLPRQIATDLAIHTVLGAAKMAQVSQIHPALLKERVTSPGGTTIAGLQALEQSGVRAAFLAAVQVATRRARELGEE